MAKTLATELQSCPIWSNFYQTTLRILWISLSYTAQAIIFASPSYTGGVIEVIESFDVWTRSQHLCVDSFPGACYWYIGDMIL